MWRGSARDCLRRESHHVALAGTELVYPQRMLQQSTLPQLQQQRRRRRLTDTLEAIVNVVTHGAVLVASVALLPVLVYLASRAGDMPLIIGVTIFALTLIGAYAAST